MQQQSNCSKVPCNNNQTVINTMQQQSNCYKYYATTIKLLKYHATTIKNFKYHATTTKEKNLNPLELQTIANKSKNIF